MFDFKSEDDTLWDGGSSTEKVGAFFNNQNSWHVSVWYISFAKVHYKGMLHSRYLQHYHFDYISLALPQIQLLIYQDWKKKWYMAKAFLVVIQTLVLSCILSELTQRLYEDHWCCKIRSNTIKRYICASKRDEEQGNRKKNGEVTDTIYWFWKYLVFVSKYR